MRPGLHLFRKKQLFAPAPKEAGKARVPSVPRHQLVQCRKHIVDFGNLLIQKRLLLVQHFLLRLADALQFAILVGFWRFAFHELDHPTDFRQRQTDLLCLQDICFC